MSILNLYDNHGLVLSYPKNQHGFSGFGRKRLERNELDIFNKTMTIYQVLKAIIWLKLFVVDAFTLPKIKALPLIKSLPILKRSTSSFVLTANTDNTSQFNSDIDMRKLKGLSKMFEECAYSVLSELSKVEFSSVKDFTKLIFDKTKPDVKLELPNGKSFLVHRVVLATRSNKFRQLLSLSSTTDTTVDSDGLTVLKLYDDVDAEVMKELLLFMYSNDFTSLSHTYTVKKLGPSLYHAALKYQVQGVIDLCESYLVGCVGTSTVLYLSDVASMYNIKRLKAATNDYINAYPGLVLNKYAKDLLEDGTGM